MSGVDREYLRSDEEAVKKIEELALKRPPAIPEHCLPTDQYL
jgi:hypothetical protein